MPRSVIIGWGPAPPTPVSLRPVRFNQVSSLPALRLTFFRVTGAPQVHVRRQRAGRVAPLWQQVVRCGKSAHRGTLKGSTMWAWKYETRMTDAQNGEARIRLQALSR